MTPETETYVEYRVRLGRETLAAAESALRDGHLHSAVNRLYYACFYVVSALLLAGGYHSPKHSGVRALFFQHYVNTGRIQVSAARFYKDIFRQRMKGDYSDLVAFEREDVEAWFHEAAVFVSELSAMVARELASDGHEAMCASDVEDSAGEQTTQ